MTIKEARMRAGLTQAGMSALLGIPKRTIENWEGGQRTPPEWTVNLIIDKLEILKERLKMTKFEINNTAVMKYAKACQEFAHDTADWDRLDDYKYYTTDGYCWSDTCDNANDGIDCSWAFHKTDEYIEQHAGEELFRNFEEEIQAAIDNECDLEAFQGIVEKFE